MKIKKNGHRVVKASLGSAVLLSLLLGGQVFAADPIVMNGQNGTANNVTEATDSTVIGNGNTVTNSKSQVVLGDNNTVTGRNNGTVSGEQEERSKNVLDVVIGKNNDISGNNTYMKGYESLTVIGNNNSATNPSATILIGDNQEFGDAKESVIIGSMTLEDKSDENIKQKNKSVVIGFGARSGARDKGGSNVAVGYGATALGWQSNVTGFNSSSGYDIMMANIYGTSNLITDNVSDNDNIELSGHQSSIWGNLNKVENSNNSMIFGNGNHITNAVMDTESGVENALMELGGMSTYILGSNEFLKGYTDNYSGLVSAAANENGGSVFALGNSNNSDYARLSQIIGTGNTLNGESSSISKFNTIAGYQNTSVNVNNTSVVGTGNTVTGETSSVIIGDYHSLEGGNNNVILGAMKTEEKTVTRSYTPFSIYSGQEQIGDPIEYTVTVKSPVITHKANLENAVMLGYNTDVTQNGGVALGAQSVASTASGVVGYDPTSGDSTDLSSSAWKSTLAAVSVGDAANNLTRQITGVAAGTELTDAVNVAQLKEVAANAADGNDKLKATDSALTIDGNILKLAIEDTAGTKVTGSVKLETIASAIDTKNTIAKGSHIDYTTKANEHGGTEYTLSVVTDGKVEAGNTGIVTGGTVYNETRVAKDGTYVKQSKSAGENLTALDSQVAANTTQITQNTNNITSISNEVSNITNNVTSLNSQVNKLDNRINRVGAGAAALAALHPQDYDPTAKWDFAAGYGNYKSANAVAIGAFYRPTNDLLFSVGTSMGGGENMFNAGVSIKFGKGSEYSNYSKTDLVSVISSQQAEISAVKADNEAIKADNEAKTKRIEALEKQMQEILSRINR